MSISNFSNSSFSNSGINPNINNLICATLRVNNIPINEFLKTNALGNVIGSVGTGGSSPITPYTVGVSQNFPTIQSAINQAVLDGHTTSNNPATVYITSGSYNEIITMAAFVNLTGINQNSVIITGSIICDYNGGCEINNISITNTNTPGITTINLNGGVLFLNNISFLMSGASTVNILHINNPNMTVLLDNCFFQGTPGVTLLRCSVPAFSLIKNSLVFGDSIISDSGGNLTLISCLIVCTTLIDGATSQCNYVNSIILTDSIAANSITINNTGTSNTLNSVYSTNPAFKVFFGDGTGSLNKSNISSLNGVTGIMGVTVNNFSPI